MNIFGGNKVIKQIRKGKATISQNINIGSKQLEQPKEMTELNLVPRPFPPESFRTLYESCEPFWATVNQIALDVAGLGFTISLKDKAKENVSEKEEITQFISRANKTQSLIEIFNLVLIDWGILGYGFIEVVRNAEGKVAELYNIPAVDMHLRDDRKLWCQYRARKQKWFKLYGDETVYEAISGKEKDVEFTERANEIIPFITHYDSRNCYGIPNILPATASAICQKEIKDYNLSFFANFAIPAMAVTLHGEWEDDAASNIKKFFDNEIRGSSNMNKTMVINVPEEGDIKFNPLTATEKEGSFRQYSEVLEALILMAYSMPPYRIGKNVQGKLGGSNIREATEIYKQSVCDPLQNKVENIINFQLIEDGMEFENYTFELNPLDTRDLKADVEMYNSMLERGILTANEIRQKIGGLESYPGGDKFYISNSLQEVGQAEMEKQDEDEMELVSQLAKLREELGINNNEEDDY